ncbi:alpha/beta hydrolase [Streptomyces sp. AV19]|uniref:alpha/beta fold hydrolase n=1 Tax=Streptomyces sp. AV19 TaxID=2793068 RepID=UPI0018FEAC05|nr:alpha/beta hydrolase [Streptomyces sp. AV19]MBH1933793.1 alpha/beta hydrolase [Streptomyces sp. AV19]MDG4535702.1 alpha/beta hydrolase [Streptomyces sp. AV19]
MFFRAQEPGLWTAGPDDGHPLVLIHGIRLSAHMWVPVTARLPGTYRVTACDLPGHGALLDHHFTLDGAIERVAAAVREATAATGRKPVVAGSSLGGVAALAYGAHLHDRAAGLFVHGATLRTDGPLLILHRAAALVQRRLGGQRAHRFNAQVLRRALPAESYQAVMAGGLSPRGFAEAIDAVRHQDMLSVAARVTTPVVFANGLDDPLLRLQERQFLDRVRRAGTPARLVHVPGPHLLPLTDPGTYGRVLGRVHAELMMMAGRAT